MILPTTILLTLLATTFQVSANPSPASAGVVHLPLAPVERRTDVHPQVLYQQHINRALSRLARANGLQGLAPAVGRRNIQDRIVKFGGGGGGTFDASKVDATSLRRREFVRIEDTVKPDAPKTWDDSSVDLAGLKRLEGGSRDVRKRRKHGKGKGNNDKAGAVALASTTAIAATSASTAVAASGSGFSDLELAAALSGDVTPGNAPTGANSLAYDIEANDVGYLATIQIGTPPKDFLMLMDSGSADTWVPSQACTQCGTHNTLGSSTFSTFKVSKQSFQVTYGSGAVAGMVVQDVVTLAGNSVTGGQSLGVALQETVDFSASTVPFDGLVGLAKSTLSDQGVPTPIEALATAGVLQAAVVSYDLGRVADGVNDGQISFGAADPARVDASTLITVPVVSTIGVWEAAVDAASVNGVDLGLSGRTAILDSGTTLIIMPPADAAAIHAAIPGAASDGAGGFTLPCTTTASLAFTFGGQRFEIDPRDLTFLPVDQNDLTGECISGISSGQIGSATQWLIGDVFLKNVIFTTDVGANTISLSKKASSVTADTAASTTSVAESGGASASAVVVEAASTSSAVASVAVVSATAAAVVASSTGVAVASAV